MRLTALLAACALALAGAACAPGETITLVAEFEDVGDLVVRANVQQSDAVVGTITSIELEQDGRWLARVTMRLEPRTPVPVGTGAVVRSTSLLGEKFVDLVPPPEVTAATPNLPDGAVIPAEATSKAPELEDAFVQLGGILASGALQDLGSLTTAAAMILEGQEEELGRVLDGSAKLVASLAAQRDALAEALDRLRSTTGTLAERDDTINRFLTTSDQAVGLLAGQRQRLDQVIVNLDRLGRTGARLMRQHRDDVDRQVKALLEIVEAVHEGRQALGASLGKLPDFTRLFAEAVPGDYIQLDVLTESPLPFGASAAAATPAEPEHPVTSILWSATR